MQIGIFFVHEMTKKFKNTFQIRHKLLITRNAKGDQQYHKKNSKLLITTNCSFGGQQINQIKQIFAASQFFNNETREKHEKFIFIGDKYDKTKPNYLINLRTLQFAKKILFVSFRVFSLF